MSKLNVESIYTCVNSCNAFMCMFRGRIEFLICINPKSDHYKHILQKDHPICEDLPDWGEFEKEKEVNKND